MNSPAMRRSAFFTLPPATRLAGMALLAAMGTTPALAATQTVPGVMCHSDGAVDRPVTGALLNAVSGSTTTTKFHCPVIRTEPVSSFGSTLTVKLNVKLNYTGTSFECVLRSTMANGTVVDSTSVVMPTKSNYNDGYWTSTFSVTLLPMTATSVNLRCNVPNIAGEPAGIMSYTVID